MHGVAAVVVASETVVVGVTVVATVVLVGLVAAVVWMLREAAALRRATGELRERAAALHDELEAVAARADEQLERVDGLVNSAESISEVVGSASRLASTAMAGPVIKAVALGSGAARAGRRLRRRPTDATPATGRALPAVTSGDDRVPRRRAAGGAGR